MSRLTTFCAPVEIRVTGSDAEEADRIVARATGGLLDTPGIVGVAVEGADVLGQPAPERLTKWGIAEKIDYDADENGIRVELPYGTVVRSATYGEDRRMSGDGLMIEDEATGEVLNGPFYSYLGAAEAAWKVEHEREVEARRREVGRRESE